MKHFRNLCALAFLAVALVATSTIASAQQNRDRDHRQLRGTWSTQVQLVDCSSGNPIGSPFRSLLTFAQGGTMTETTANPNFYPAERGPGHGVWNGHDDGYSAASTALITLNGVLQSTQVIRQAITMNDGPDSFGSVATVQFFDPNGNLLKSGCATATGIRFNSALRPWLFSNQGIHASNACPRSYHPMIPAQKKAPRVTAFVPRSRFTG